MKSLAPLTALFLVLASCEDIPLALTAKEQVAEYKASSNPAAAPTFNPPANTYNTDQLITISSSTIGATLRYTTDGSVPNAQSPVYTGPVSVTAPGGVINAIAQKSGFKDSAVGTAAYTIDYDAVAIPQISPSTGTFSTDQLVSVTSSTTGAVVYYTLDGSDPTENSPVYSGPIPVAGHGTVKTVKALATKSKMKNSGVSSSTVTIAWPQVGQPQFLPGTGTYSEDQTVTLTTSTVGATIHYTLDGTTPTAASLVYDLPLLVSGNGTTKTIKAMAESTGYVDSSVNSATITINYAQVSSVQFTPAPGTFETNLSITLTTSTPGASIYYTTDDSTPTVLYGTAYTGPITLNGPAASLKLKALAVKGGMADSALSSATYAVQWPSAPAPQFSLLAGTYSTDQTVTLSVPTSGATVFYTTDGSQPTASSPSFSSATVVTIPVTGPNTSKTLRAFTRKPGSVDSGETSGTYTVQWPTLSAPTFSSLAGSLSGSAAFSSDTSISLANPTTGVTIYYTFTVGTSGPDPTTGSNQYTGSASLDTGSQTGAVTRILKAFAVKDGSVSSPVSSLVVTITYPAVEAPTFTTGAGDPTFTTNQLVNLSTTTPGANIYYTTDGTTPAAVPGNLFPTAGQISVNGDAASTPQMTIKAFASKAGYTDSPVVSTTITIAWPQVAAPVFSKVTGTYGSDQLVNLSSAAGTSLRYTTDGSLPTSDNGSTPMMIPNSEAFSVLGDGTIKTFKAYASAANKRNSPLATSTITIAYTTPKVTDYTGVPNSRGDSTTPTVFQSPWGIAWDSSGYLLVGDATSEGKIRKFDPATPANSTVFAQNTFFNDPRGITVMGADLYVASQSLHRIQKLDSNAVRTFLAGGSSGSTDATGSSAQFNAPWGMTNDGTDLFVADTGNHSIRRVTTSGVVTTLAGSGGISGSVNATGTTARFNTPKDIISDGAGNLYVADAGNHLIRKIVVTTGEVTTLAGGSGGTTSGFLDGTGTSALFNDPTGLATDGANLYVADSGNYAVRKVVLSTGVVTTIAGTGSSGHLNGNGAGATFNKPIRLTYRSGSLYVIDDDFSYGNNVIRRIEL